MKKIIKLTSSLKLAVTVLLVLAVLTAVGTIIEARYDAQAAAKLIYHTPWMYGILLLLSINLIAVMVDRWPWKKRHVPFILAHIGILILLLGALITSKYGLDGTMRFGIGETNRFLTVPATELQIWASFDGDRYSKILEKEVDFFIDSPKKHPLELELPEGTFKVQDYAPYVIPSRKIIASESKISGAALRFLVRNDRASINEWLFQKKAGAQDIQKFGLATFVLGNIPLQPPVDNVIYLHPQDAYGVEYLLTYKDARRKRQRGVLREGEVIQTDWMGLEFRLLRYFEHAEESFDFKTVDRPSDLSTSAIKVSFQNKTYWLQLNDVVKIFTNDAVYIAAYGNRRIDLGFDLQLQKFEIGRDPGTNNAASYQSLVSMPDGKQALITMNEPLKYQGLTFYQASFQDGPDGVPVASVLSVNYDPGRWLKYLGSFIITLGVAWLFVNKRKAARAQAPSKEVV